MPAFEVSNIGGTSSSSLPEILSRQDRVLRFGVDCSGPANSDGIEYRHGEWSPGGEYTKQLSVKNVGLKTIKLKYKLPATRYVQRTLTGWGLMKAEQVPHPFPSSFTGTPHQILLYDVS